jgi:hypothetical protein
MIITRPRPRLCFNTVLSFCFNTILMGAAVGSDSTFPRLF